MKYAVRKSFADGILKAFDVKGLTRFSRVKLGDFSDDYMALRGDWIKVGESIKNAEKQYSKKTKVGIVIQGRNSNR